MRQITRRRTFVALATLLCASVMEAQRSPYRPIKVRSCAFADSLLGPARGDTRGEVRGFHHKERDSTYLMTGEEVDRPHLNWAIKLAGKRPARDPAAQMVLWLRGDTARAIAATGEKPAVRLVLNDTVVIVPPVVALGRFEGPADAPMVLPVSALIPADDLLTAAQALTITLHVDAVAMHVSQQERRDLRASIRVAVCPP